MNRQTEKQTINQPANQVTDKLTNRPRQKRVKTANIHTYRQANQQKNLLAKGVTNKQKAY